MLRALWVVFLKEARDLVRDRRALFFLLAPPILGPLLGIAGLFFISWQVARQAPEGLAVAVEGAEYAPELVARLEEEELLRLTDLPPDPWAALRDGELMALLTIPPDTPSRLEAELPVTITLTTSRVGWMPTLVNLTVQGVVGDYGQALLARRLSQRGLDPGWVRPLRLVEGEAPTSGIVAPPAETTGAGALARSFNGLMLPFMVASWAMGGGLGLISYMTVGEKERGTMEPMLVTAASRVGIALGKIALSMLVSLIIVVLWTADGLGYLLLVNLSASVPTGHVVPLGLQIQAFGLAGLWLFLLLLPLLVLVSGLTAAICTFARNYREATLFITVLQLGLPALSFAAVFVVPATPAPFVYAIPFAGVLIAVRDLFLQGLPPSLLVLTVVSAVVYAVLSVLLAAYVFSREWALMRGL